MNHCYHPIGRGGGVGDPVDADGGRVRIEECCWCESRRSTYGEAAAETGHGPHAAPCVSWRPQPTAACEVRARDSSAVPCPSCEGLVELDADGRLLPHAGVRRTQPACPSTGERLRGETSRMEKELHRLYDSDEHLG